MVKNLPAMRETWDQEDPLENGMATHFPILAWGIPWAEEPDGLQCVGLQWVRHDWATNTAKLHVCSPFDLAILLLGIYPNNMVTKSFLFLLGHITLSMGESKYRLRLVGKVPARSLMSDCLQPHGQKPTRLLCLWNFPARILEPVAISISRASSSHRHWTCLLHWQADSLPLCYLGPVK